MSSKLDFLAQLPLFDRLHEEELLALDAISHEYEFQHGAVVAYQRDVADEFYIVRNGRLYAEQVDKNGLVRDSRDYLPGSWFNETWLFESHAHDYTVRSSGLSRVIIINQKDFLQLLKDMPDLLEGLEPDYEEDEIVAGLSEIGWEKAQLVSVKADKPSKAVDLLAEELVEFYTRRSKWYLLIRVVPIMFFTVILTVAAIGFVALGSTTLWGWALPALVFIIGSLFAGFFWLDWSNDYFVITNKHITHREFRLPSFSANVNKIPIDQVQSVTSVKPSFIANLFNLGTARITTSAQAGVVLFDNIDDPQRVMDTLERQTKRVQALDAGHVQAAMRASLESHFQVEPAYQKIESENTQNEDAEEAKNKKRPSPLYRIRRRYGFEVVEGNAITYRKHWFSLLREIGWPLIIIIAMLFLSQFVVSVLDAAGITAVVIMILINGVGLASLIWKIEDWRNDMFQVTDQYVVDIDRKPFGFGESRKQAELKDVQNINADRPSFWATFFNYGNVHIETAGAAADITFELVKNPNRVQSEIFQRREQFRKKMRVREGENRRKEYAVLMDVYQQSREQNIIPRRTPK